MKSGSQPGEEKSYFNTARYQVFCDDAKAALDKARESNPLNLELLKVSLGYCNQAVELNSTASLAYYRRANVFLDLKMYALAIGDYSRCLGLDRKPILGPNTLYTVAHQSLGIAYKQLNQKKSAVGHYEKSRDFDQFAREQYELLKNQVDPASEEEKAIQSTLKDKAIDQVLREAKETKNDQIAIVYCNYLINHWPEDPRAIEAYYLRGKANYRKGNCEEAIEDLNYAIGREIKDKSGAFNYLGRCYAQLFESISRKKITPEILISMHSLMKIAEKSFVSGIDYEAAKGENITHYLIDLHFYLGKFYLLLSENPDYIESSDKTKAKLNLFSKALHNFDIALECEESYVDGRGQLYVPALVFNAIKDLPKKDVYDAIQKIKPDKAQINLMQKFLDQGNPVFGAYAFQQTGYFIKPSFESGNLNNLVVYYLKAYAKNEAALPEKLKERHRDLVKRIPKKVQQQAEQEQKTAGAERPVTLHTGGGGPFFFGEGRAGSQSQEEEGRELMPVGKRPAKGNSRGDSGTS